MRNPQQTRKCLRKRENLSAGLPRRDSRKMPPLYLRKLAVILSSLLRERCIPPSAAVPDALCGRILANAAVLIILCGRIPASAPLPKMRIRFGTILSPPLMWQWNVLTIYHRRINNRSEEDENMVWTDSQDYGSDEILSHPFALTPPVQRAACALHFAGSVPTKINRNRSINPKFTPPF